ncbi:MAG: hypothetical protein ACREV5_20690 [Steroidobacter sp.]
MSEEAQAELNAPEIAADLVVRDVHVHPTSNASMYDDVVACGIRGIIPETH